MIHHDFPGDELSSCHGHGRSQKMYQRRCGVTSFAAYHLLILIRTNSYEHGNTCAWAWADGYQPPSIEQVKAAAGRGILSMTS
jgi:hypothetical protein